MKVSIILALIGIAMGNDRLRNFRRYHKVAKSSRKVSSRSRSPPAGHDRIPSTLRRVCTTATCAKCEKILLSGGRKEFCSILLVLKNCCSSYHLARRGF